ncbi:MAG: DUF2382 domain-containing protein [Methylacidiphilales bacterium]|nr:DUF2382 domain-containing protein [Candidatus Methylacidiphilales bacterium]NJR18321.1 DUF2382 domain-containing protein [Calothrix sp. CSU_2_0]
MPLYKLADFDTNYQETFDGNDITSLDLYTEGEVRIGSVADVLVDDDGKFRYLVIDVMYDSTDKRILLPIGLSRIDYNRDRVYVDGLSKEQVERLPEYREDIIADYDYEEKVRQAYRSTPNNVNYDRNTYNYQQDAHLYDSNAPENQTFKLYEERLIANKNRVKTGEVTIGKHIESETRTVSVPLEKERVVIERVKPSQSSTVTDSSELKFQEGEVARIEVYEETPNIRKEAFVREEIRIKKVVEEETVEREETIRREELDVDTQGNLNVNKTNLS